ncbi:hypothetical protein AVEN_3116-1, partial [Araneus ventricosus]
MSKRFLAFPRALLMGCGYVGYISIDGAYLLGRGLCWAGDVYQ